MTGGSGKWAGVTAAEPVSGCGSTKVRENCREADPIRLLPCERFGTRTDAWGALTAGVGAALAATAAGAGTICSALDGPPMDRTDSVTLAPAAESNTSRKVTSLFFG